MTVNEIEDVLHTLMRGIDKKTTLAVEPQPDASEPAVTVQLRRDKRSGSLQVTEADLFASQTDLMRRNRVRTALKRARDRMWEEERPIFSTKVTHTTPDKTWMRPTQGGRGRR